MALSNAERQARHRERIKAKLAAASEVADEPLRNDECDLLDQMNEAFEEGHAKGVLNVVDWQDRRNGLPDEDDPWFKPRARLLGHPRFKPRPKEKWIAFAREHGEKLGDYLALSLRRDALHMEIDARDAEKQPEPVKKRRKRVT